MFLSTDVDFTAAIHGMSEGYNQTQLDYLTINATTEPVNDDTSGKGGLPMATVIFMIVGAFGMVDNGMVVLVIANSKKMRTAVTNLFIINQSIIDLLTSFFMLVNFPTGQPHTILSGISGNIYHRFSFKFTIVGIIKKNRIF